MYSKLKKKLRFNRLTKITRFKNRISANEACTYWLKSNKNKFIYDSNIFDYLGSLFFLEHSLLLLIFLEKLRYY